MADDFRSPEVNPLEGHYKYVKLRNISSGSYGFVVLALDQDTNEQVAIKFIERSKEKITKNVEREILNHYSLIHPHVVRFRECFLTERYLAIAMEFAAGGDMYRFVTSRKGLCESMARWFFQQTVLALDYCHKMRISNRDVKLENTLLDSDGTQGKRPLIKLCDFGYSINETHSMAKTAVGTPGYTAPEVLRSPCGTGYNSKQADVWSAGVMLYAMLFCSYPFDRREDADDPKYYAKMTQRIFNAEYTFPESRPVTDACKDLLRRILVVDPAKRITISAIQLHPWFRLGLPLDLNLDMYNQHYLDLSRETGGAADRIRAVIREAIHSPRAPEPAHAQGRNSGNLVEELAAEFSAEGFSR